MVTDRLSRAEGLRLVKPSSEDRAQLDEFISSVSHDLRTPLAAIKASVGVLLANEPDDLPEPLHRLLVNIDFATDELADMVANLLELVRIQSGVAAQRSQLHDLRGLVHRVAEVFEPVAKRQNQVLQVRMPGTRVMGYCDAVGTQRALLNLLSNAHKFAGAGTTIRLTLHRQRGKVVFSVADDGPGVDPADRERIFQRSSQSRGGPPPGKRGAGLGLPVARAVAELHGGSISVDSKPGEGATFRLALPRVPAVPGAEPTSQSSAQPATAFWPRFTMSLQTTAGEPL